MSASSFALAVVFTSTVALTALAAPPGQSPQDRAYELAEDAAADRARGDLDAAIAKLKEAVRLYPDSALSYNLGRTYEDSELFDLAQHQYEQCLGAGSDPEVVQRAKDGLERVNEARKFGRLIIVVEPATATIRIDGVPSAVDASRTVKLPTGPHEIVVSANGYRDETFTAEIPRGRALRRAVTLQRLSEVIAVGSPSDPVVVSTEAPSRFGPWPWIALGVGVALVGTGGALLGLGQADFDEMGSTAPEDQTLADAQALIDSGEMKQAAGWGVLSVGAAAVIAGVVLAVLPPDTDSESVFVSPTITFSPESLTLGVRLDL